jgi:hypothetical protein
MTSIQNKVFVYYFGGQLDKYLRNNKLMKAHGKNGLLLLLLAQEFLHVKVSQEMIKGAIELRRISQGSPQIGVIVVLDQKRDTI